MAYHCTRRTPALALLVFAGTTIAFSAGCQSVLGTGGLVAGATAGIAMLAGMDTEEALLLGAAAGAIAAGIQYAIVEAEEREASRLEEQKALAEAEDRSRTLLYGEQQAIEQQDAKLAVIVGETDTEYLVMIADPKTGQVATAHAGTVYEVPRSELDDLETLADVQARVKDPEVRESLQLPARDVERAVRQAETGVSEDQVELSNTAALHEPEDIKFGRLGSEDVIFRL